MAAGEVGEDAAGFGEADVGALADGEVAEGLGDVGLADADGAEEDDRLADTALSLTWVRSLRLGLFTSRSELGESPALKITSRSIEDRFSVV
ncbi:hypothetical protein [Streptomyces sp. NPDC001843]|uniref:hypothetical protein n=1 Tax=Streptomyces sp. NPDC001843 TaxID=3364617 RepID=UPI0036C25FCE